MMGGALGALEARILPVESAGFWPLISMGAILGGTMRSPFTGVIFALELTHDVNVLLPLLVATVIAHLFTVLTLRRSILTEKVSRRGYHLSREYAVDPLEILFVRDVMRTNIVALPADLSPAGLAQSLRSDSVRGGQHLFPIVDAGGCVAGVVTRKDLRKLIEKPLSGGEAHGFAGLVRRNPVVAYADEPLRVVVYRMAEKGVTRMPVVEREDCRKLLGMVALSDLLKARVRNLEEERRRERVLPLHLVFPLGARRSKGSQVN